MPYVRSLLAITTATLLIVGVGLANSSDPAAPDRWYTQAQVNSGNQIYHTQCATCHGEQAEGQPNWQERGPLGYYPAPPLNGSGHSAQHSLPQMLTTLDSGGGPLGGTMPSFADVLNDGDKRAVIAYIQSLWPDSVYRMWQTDSADGAVRGE